MVSPIMLPCSKEKSEFHKIKLCLHVFQVAWWKPFCNGDSISAGRYFQSFKSCKMRRSGTGAYLYNVNVCSFEF